MIAQEQMGGLFSWHVGAYQEGEAAAWLAGI